MPQQITIEAVDWKKSERCTLSIRLGMEAYSFFIFNPVDDTVAIVEKGVNSSLSVTANLKKVFQEVDFIDNRYKRINVISTGNRFLFVPLELFEDEQIQTLFYHSHLPKENEEIQYNILKRNNLVVLFGMDRSAVQFLTNWQPEVKFFAQITLFLNHYLLKSRLGDSRKLFAYLHKNRTDIYCFEQGKLLLANSFECKETEDIVYYLLYVWKQLDYDQQQDELYLSGDHHEKERLLTELGGYVRQISVMDISANIDMETITSCE
jgi:hypothetical protein